MNGCLILKIKYLIGSLWLFSLDCPSAEYSCLIEPSQMIELGSSVTGRIEHTLVKRGDMVKKSQPLVTLEANAERSASELAKFKSQQVGPSQMAESKMEFSKKKLARRQAMTSQKLMAPQESEDTEAEYRLAEAELQLAKENRQIANLELQQQNSLLELRTIKSPVEGVVVDQEAYVGEVFEPSSNKKYIYKIAEMNPLKVHVILPKDQFGKLKIDMSANVIPEIPHNSHYSAKVKIIDRLIDAASGTFVVFLELPNPKLEIPAGVKCTITFPALNGSASK